MKRIKYLLFALILCILIIPNVYAKESIEIKSVELEEKSDNATILSEPTFNGLDMNFNISFKVKNDYAKYKVIVKNNTDNEYQISEETGFNNSEYVKYSYSVENELKPQGEAVLHVTITYDKEVAEALMVDNKYTESTKATVQLLDDKGNVIEIPDTLKNVELDKVLIVTAISIIFVISTEILLSKRKSTKVIIGLLLAAALIPTVKAVETLKLNINLNVEIDKGYEVTYTIHHYMTIKDSEKDDYDLSQMNCYATYYIGGMEEENKYLHCSGDTVIKDPKLYVPGETVNLPVKVIKSYYFSGTGTPVEGETNTYYLSDSSSLRENNVVVNSWRYYRNDETQAENELEIIEPSPILDNYWNKPSTSERYVAIGTPGTFKMPAHDVLMDDNLPRK